ncbi:proline-, glutamic acid- and leucine-rich protein 1-like [Nematostella vectensis]|uniref:proline-, glutamic acid- and leucine-rich protein 1-like n=1 Tax=Nematostella vectensis TaxID=45351 RepID=UPI002077037C|nr:proline-, glutamic acid- and leucine-rich protein 1-like [Nematostella vectensis]
MLYEGTSEHSSSESRVQLGELLSLKDVPDEEPSRTMTLATRCAAMLDALTAMTRTGISRFAVIPLEQTLQLVERVSSITEPVLKQSGSLTVVLLRTVLPLVHIPAIDLLSALIQRCGSLLLPFTSQIGNLLTRALGWTGNATNNNHEQARPYSKLRCAVYECTINWSHLNCSLSQQMFSKLVASILSDITPQVSQTKLIAPVDQGRSKKAKKRKLQEDVEELATRQRKMNPLCNKSVCNKALQGLSSLLMDGVKMPANIFQDLQSAVLSLILQCQSTYPLPPPYSDVVCRQGLYRGLLACLICRPPGAPSIIHCAVQCFTCGMQDPSLQISCYCREALTVTTALMHPAVPTLGETFQLVKLQSAFHFTSSIERPPLHANDELSRESQKSLVVSGESISTMRSDDQEPRMNETSPSDVPTRGNIVGVDSSTSQTGNLVDASRRQMDSCTTSESKPMETTTTNDVRKSSKMVYPEDQFSDPKHAPKSIATETRSTVETLDHLLSNSKGNSVKKISNYGEMSKTKNMPSSLSNGSENVVKKVPDVPPPKKTRYEETSPELKNTTQGSERMVTGEVRVNKSAAAATNAEASTVDMGCSLKQAEDDMEAMLASFVNSSPDSDELDHYEL